MMASPKTRARGVRRPAPIFQLRIELLGIKPAIWRRVLVPGSIRLSRLHGVFLTAMGWMGGHLHEFVIGEDNYGMPDPDYPDPPVMREDRKTLAAALGGLKAFIYLYDFGDGWEHRVKVERVLPGEPPLPFVMCVGGANACPPEDVGGPPGYMEFLDAIRAPSHQEHQAMLAWWGGQFDPGAFDVDEVNRALSHIKL